MPADPAAYAALLDDLAAEQSDLARLVDGADLTCPTPAEGWDVADCLAHLAWFDEQAVLAATDPDAFRDRLRRLLGASTDPDAVVAEGTAHGRSLGPDGVLAWWGQARDSLLAALRLIGPAQRLPWFGPDMGAMSFASARLMETWAHGQDVADGLGRPREPTARLRHVVLLGWRTLPNSYLVRGLTVPAAPVRVEVTAPDGSAWTHGPEDAADVVTGPALDLCLVVTQRRHRADTALRARGPVAEEWLSLAQAFAGPPGAGRRPGQGASPHDAGTARPAS